MELEREQIVKLSNGNEYVVVMKDIFEGNEYVYLINIKDEKDYMFCKHEDSYLDIVTQSDLVEKLLLHFTKKISE